MDRGVTKVSMSARNWGRAGLVALLLSACAPALAPVGPEAVSLPAVVEPAVERSPASEAMPVAPVEFEGAVAPAPTPAPNFAPGPSTGGVWAVVVGIDDYPGGASDLRSAGNDASDMDTLLTRAGVPPERRVRLVDGQATADVLRQALDWLVARAGPGSTAIFFFAGHVRRLGGSTEALVGADGKLVADAEVAARLTGLQASKTWLVVAACYGGGFVEAMAPGRILTAAAPADRLAYENLTLRRSYLVEYLVRRALLEGRASGSVEAAFAWADAAVRREHPGRVPVQFDRLDGELTLTLGPSVTASALPRQPQPPPSQPPPPPRPRQAPTTTTSTVPDEEDCGFTMGTVLHCPD